MKKNEDLVILLSHCIIGWHCQLNESDKIEFDDVERELINIYWSRLDEKTIEKYKLNKDKFSKMIKYYMVDQVKTLEETGNDIVKTLNEFNKN